MVFQRVTLPLFVFLLSVLLSACGTSQIWHAKVIVRIEATASYASVSLPDGAQTDLLNYTPATTQQKVMSSPDKSLNAIFNQKGSGGYAIDISSATGVFASFTGPQLPPHHDPAKHAGLQNMIRYRWTDNQHLIVSDTSNFLYVVTVDSNAKTVSSKNVQVTSSPDSWMSLVDVA